MIHSALSQKSVLRQGVRFGWEQVMPQRNANSAKFWLNPDSLVDALPYITALRGHVERCDFAGYDPYDALNSPLVRVLTLRTVAGRIAWTQFFRRFPLNLRPLCLVPRRVNAKALGLFVESYSKLLTSSADAQIGSTLEHLLNKLQAVISPGYAGVCWGYPFDWQSRAAFVPAGTPTIVNTAFIGHALVTCHELTGSQRALDMALRIPPFLLKDLNRLESNSGFCFSYTPIDRNFVHNANMLGASLLLRLGRLARDHGWVEAARSSMAYSMACQRPDGSWPYAETNFQNWIDSFHTGFNLEALRWFVRQEDASPEWGTAYQRGLDFYVHHFFLDDGTPKYYHNQVYPIDIHSPAEAVYLLAGAGEEYRPLTERVLGWMIENLWDARRGCFYFRKSRWMTNKIPYMRWSQAWGMRALVEYHVQKLNGR